MNPDLMSSNSQSSINSAGQIPLPKKRKTPIFVAAIILIFVAASGASAYWYFVVSPNPERAFVKALASYKNVESLAYSARLEGKFEFQKNPDFQFGEFLYTVNSNGKVGFKGDASVVDMKYGVVIKSLNEKGKADASADAEFISKDSKAYLKFNAINLSYVPTMPDPITAPAVQLVDSVLQGTLNQWIAFDMNLKDWKEKAEEKQEGSSEESTLFDSVNEIKELESETVNNVDSNHYQVHVNNEKIKQMYIDDQNKVSMTRSISLLAAVNAYGQNLSTDTTVIDVWIGKKDRHFTKIAFSEIKFADEETGMITLKGEINFKNYNVPVSVIVPSQTVTVDQISNQVMTGFMAPKNQSSGQIISIPIPDSKLVSQQDKDQIALDTDLRIQLTTLRPQFEMFYDDKGSYVEVCKDGGINRSASSYVDNSVRKILDIKNATTQSKAGVQCASSKEGFTASVKLLSGENFCTDSLGYSGYGNINKGTFSCVKPN